MKSLNPSTPSFDRTRSSQTVKFYTLGCKVNQYDTQMIRERFIEAGCQELDNNHPADICVINTCTVTQRADAESLNSIRKAKRENPQAKIAVTGCLTQFDGNKIKKIPGTIKIINNRDKEKIVELLKLGKQPGRRYGGATITYFKGHSRAFLKIQDGCNNRCSYCKVPLVRGPSRSKPFAAIIAEAKGLAENGYREIVLTGICLGAWGRELKPKTNLVAIVKALEKISPLKRIRLSSIEAGDISDGLIKRIAQSQKLCRHLHIPIQSADNNILKKMRRNYSREDYLGIVRKIKKAIPQIAISTDVLAGFPTETETEFANTVDFIKEIAPMRLHMFPYSIREGTAAAEVFTQTCHPDVIKERIAQLKSISRDCALVYMERFLGKTMDVLIEARVREESGFWQGYTDNYIKVKVSSKKDLESQIIPLKLKKIENNFMLGDFA